MFLEVQALQKEVIELAFPADYGLHKLVCYLNTILPRHEEEANSERTCTPLLLGEKGSNSRVVLEALAHLQASNSRIY